MKKLIAISALITAGISFAQSTSSTNLDVSKMSLKERMSADYFTEIVDTIAGNGEGRNNDVSMYNSVSLRFRATNVTTLQFNPRFMIYDTAGSGTEDRLRDEDFRFGIAGNFISSQINTNIQYIIAMDPDARETSDGQLRISNGKGIKLDDVNSLFVSVQLRKYFYRNTDGPVNDIRLLPYLSYSNTKFSEKVSIRADYEGYFMQPSDKDLNYFAQAEGVTSQRVVLGPNITTKKGSIYPYAAHYFRGVKSADQLGYGVQYFHAF